MAFPENFHVLALDVQIRLSNSQQKTGVIVNNTMCVTGYKVRIVILFYNNALT